LSAYRTEYSRRQYNVPLRPNKRVSMKRSV